jgi:dTDP-6-deoxy-L-talose 4-dehydrogenase (NAD+)
MRILVTGATGFIGRHVVEYLLSCGHSLITTARRSKEEVNDLCPLLKNTEYISINLNEKNDNYYAFFKKPDCVIHLSWEGVYNYNELFHIEQNLPANYHFIKSMIQNGLSDITIAGSCFEYGMQNGCLNEDMLTIPVTVYGLAKDTLRKFVETLQTKCQFSMKWMRVFYVCGHGKGERSLYTQLEETIMNKDSQFNMSLGEQLRDYLPVTCAAEYISKVALQNNVTGIINCCSGKPISVRSFVENFFEERKYNIKLNRGVYPYPTFEPVAFWGDNSKLQSIIM